MRASRQRDSKTDPLSTLPLHVEIFYNEYNFVAAFACASLLALLALVTLVLKAFVESRSRQETL